MKKTEPAPSPLPLYARAAKAERAFIGAACLDPRVIDDVAPDLSGDRFVLSPLGYAWDRMRAFRQSPMVAGFTGEDWTRAVLCEAYVWGVNGGTSGHPGFVAADFVACVSESVSAVGAVHLRNVIVQCAQARDLRDIAADIATRLGDGANLAECADILRTALAPLPTVPPTDDGEPPFFIDPTPDDTPPHPLPPLSAKWAALLPAAGPTA